MERGSARGRPLEIARLTATLHLQPTNVLEQVIRTTSHRSNAVDVLSLCNLVHAGQLLNQLVHFILDGMCLVFRGFVED